MRQDNLEFLKQQITYLGFGESMGADLEKNLKEGKKEFQLPFTAEFKKGDKKEIVDFNLELAQSKKDPEMYFLNRYTGTLKKENPEKEHTQTFYVGKENNITAKEAYNLLDGRAVNKNLVKENGDEYNAWLQMTGKKDERGNIKFQPYHEKYGFDLEKNLAKLPVKDMDNATRKEDLLKSLSKGNLQQVTLNLNGTEEKAFLEANPKDRNIILYDSNMVKQNQGVKAYKGESQEKQQGEKNESESTKKESTKETQPDQKKSKSRKMSAR